MLNASKKYVRIFCGVLACVLLVSATGCNIKKYEVSTEQKLISSEEDKTIWVEDGVTTSEYSETENIYESQTESSSSSSSSSSSNKTEIKEEVVDFKFTNLKQYQFGSSDGYLLKASDFIKDAKVHNTIYAFDDFKIEDGSSGGWGYDLGKDITVKSYAYHNLGHNGVKMYEHFREWAFNFFMSDEITSGNGVLKGGGGFSITPTSRKLALQLLEKELIDLYSLDLSKPLESCLGHYFWHHYSVEWGADIICNEIGEVISSIQSHNAFTRGAARQYGVPWSIQFSPWGSDGSVVDHTGLNFHGQHSHPNGGHSTSLYRRAFLTTYMGGASHYYPEGGSLVLFLNKKNAAGVYELSPHGEMVKKMTDFVNENRNIGTNYIPFGIVLDYYHGMYSGRIAVSKMRAFQVFPYTDGDHMIFNLLDKFFPNSWEVHLGQESNYMVNGPYGDTCDVLLQNASQKVLNSYPCLILAGSIDLSNEEIKRYKNYVKQGGTLILNTAYLEFFPEYAKKYNGEARHDINIDGGRVIVFGDDYKLNQLDGILKDMLAEYVPFTFSEDVEYMVNVKNGSLIVTVINNNGHRNIKEQGGPVIDESKTIDLTIKYTGNLKAKRVSELWYGETLPTSNEVTVKLTPGDSKVIEFYFG